MAGDGAYGMVPTLRDALDAEDWRYMLDVPATTPVCGQVARAGAPPWGGRGGKPTKARLTPDAPTARTVAAIAAGLPADAWREVTVAEGSRGPRTDQLAALRVWESRAGRACWLLLRRNRAGGEPRHYLSNAPEGTPLLTLARVAAARWTIETGFETAKGETGLDEYEVRGWPGWHHHITLALLAGASLLTVQQDWGEKDAPAHPPPGQPRAARALTPPHLDARGVAPVAQRHPRAQRARHTLTHRTPPPQAA